MKPLATVYWLRCSAVRDTDATLEAILDASERARHRRLVFADDRRRFLVAHAQTRIRLGQQLGIAPEQLRFTDSGHGKPVLIGMASGAQGALRFSLSHSGDFLALAIATDREIGVDIEALRPVPDADQLVMRFFSAAERKEYESLAIARRNAAFLSGWTRKEAFIKATGEGLSRPLDSFDVSVDPSQPARLLRVDAIPGDLSGWQLRSFDHSADFAGAVVFTGTEQEHVEWIGQ